MRQVGRVFVWCLGGVLAAGSAMAGPISPLYLTRDNQITVVQGNGIVDQWDIDSGETAIAVDTTVRTGGTEDPLTGKQYSLTGDTIAGPLGSGVALTFDGTTNGTTNFGISYDTGTVYQYNLDWTSPLLLFQTNLLDGVGITFDAGATSDASDDSLWVMQYISANTPEFGPEESEFAPEFAPEFAEFSAKSFSAAAATGTRVQQFSMTGTLLSSFRTGLEGTLGLALDPVSQSLWLWHDASGASALYEFSKSGTMLSSMALTGQTVWGAEFSLSSQPSAISEPGTLMLLAAGVALVARRRARRR